VLKIERLLNNHRGTILISWVCTPLPQSTMSSSRDMVLTESGCGEVWMMHPSFTQTTYLYT